MVTKVLVVDDSSFFRRVVTDIVNADPKLKVVGYGVNGREAVAQVMALKPDVVVMDVEMPVMDGITAVKKIMACEPTPILMFSSITVEGAKASLEALDAGALHFLPKKFEEITRDRQQAEQTLQKNIHAIAGRKHEVRLKYSKKVGGKPPIIPSPNIIDSAPAVADTSARPGAKSSGAKDVKLVVIGASTGGPVAVQELLQNLPANFPIPVVVVQHMPGTFTAAFAERLNSVCKLSVKEAENTERLKAGSVYVAPGGKQLTFKGDSVVTMEVKEGSNTLTYRPCVDVTLESAAKVYSGYCLSIILTGMGSDGKSGSKALKNSGGKVWAQDAKSCVVSGMPMAVISSGITDYVANIAGLKKKLMSEF